MKSLLNPRLWVLLIVAALGAESRKLPAAEPDPLLEEIGLAELQAAAEERVARTVAARSTGKLARLEMLQASGHASWRELAEVRSESVRDTARLTAVEQFRVWMRGLQAKAVERASERTPVATAVARLDVSLPGSLGVLGWVRPERLPSAEREVLLDLLVRRSAMLADSSHEIATEQCQRDFCTQRMERLSSQDQVSDGEREQSQSQQCVTRARLALAEAVQERRRREHETLVSAIASWRDGQTVSGDVDRRSRLGAERLLIIKGDGAERHRQRLIAVLTYEASAQGELELARAAWRLANFVVRGSDALRGMHHISRTHLRQVEHDLGRSQTEWDRFIAWKEWQTRWVNQFLRTESLLLPAARFVTGGDESVRATDFEPGFGLASSCRHDRPLARKEIALVRQWYEARSEWEAAQAELQWRTEFVQRLRQQAQPNLREITIAEYTIEICVGRDRVASERAGLVRLFFDQMASAADDGSACELSLIGDSEAAMILSSFEQRAARCDLVPVEQRIADGERQVEALKRLRALGHASVNEVARAELSLSLAKCERDSLQFQLQLAELDGQLMKRMLGLRDGRRQPMGEDDEPAVTK